MSHDVPAAPPAEPQVPMSDVDVVLFVLDCQLSTLRKLGDQMAKAAVEAATEVDRADARRIGTTARVQAQGLLATINGLAMADRSRVVALNAVPGPTT